MFVQSSFEYNWNDMKLITFKLLVFWISWFEHDLMHMLIEIVTMILLIG